MSDKHSMDEFAETDEMSGSNNKVNRRRFVKSLGAAGGLVGLQAIPATASAKNLHSANQQDDIQQAIQEADVQQVNRAKALGRALSKDNVRSIMRTFTTEKGWMPQFSDAIAYKTEYEGESWNTVVLPFDDGDPTQEEQTYLTWSNNPKYEFQVSGHHTGHHVPDDAEAYWDVTRYTVQNGEVVTEHETVMNFLGCSNIGWGCVLTLASLYGGTIITCGTCIASSGWLITACARCVLALLGTGGATILCDWCKD